MSVPIFTVCNADTQLLALMPDADNVLRFYPYGEAPQDVVRPYAVYQEIGGLPENYLHNRPDADNISYQVNIYALTAPKAKEVFEAMREAIEPVAYITRFAGEGKDSITNDYGYSFDVDWIVLR